MKGLLLCPDPASFISGGNLYNQRLMQALGRAGIDLQRRAWSQLHSLPDPSSFDWVLVDTLFADQVSSEGLPEELRQVPTGLLCHYLPGMETWSQQSDAELIERWGWIVEAFQFLVVPSPFLAVELLTRLGFSRPIFKLPPILGAGPERRPVRAPGPLWAIMAANLTPLKGILPLLEALEEQATEPLQAKLELTIFGHTHLDPDYAQACRLRIEQSDMLLGAVRLQPPIDPEDLQHLYGLADLYVSSSRFETFGMAVCESVLHGTPVLALDAGNVKHLLAQAVYGSTFPDPAGLAGALLDWCGRLPELAGWKADLWQERPRHDYTEARVVEHFREIMARLPDV